MDQEAFDQSLFLAARLVERRDFVDAAIALRPWLETDLEGKGLGRNDDALMVYRSLMPEILSHEERQRIQQNIDLLRQDS